MMNNKNCVLLTIICAFAVVISAAVSAYYAFSTDIFKLVFGELLAPVNINIEIGKNFANNISVFSESMSGYYYLSPTSAPAGERVMIHVEYRFAGFHGPLLLRLPEENSENALKSIDNISVFIGNKVYYFTKDEISRFEKSEDGDYAFFRLPEMRYLKSFLVKNWINYYGDFNIALKLLCAFFFSPNKFIAPWLFIYVILFFYRKELFQKYNTLRGKKYTAAILLAGITLLAFLLRINGYVRHSAWSDELYSAALASNPNTPFLSVFMDHGNPPAYFLLLKYWFKLTGWNESSGTLLSVLLGTLACPSLYLFLRKSIDKKTALIAAFFMAIAGFAVEYSQEMRTYILNMALIPLISFLFLRVVKKCSLLNLALYIITCVVIANAHYYGILFIVANFIFYCIYCILRKQHIIKILKFLAANIITALSFMPFFLHKLFIDRYDFSRGFVIRADHTLIFILLISLTIAVFVYRKKLACVSFIAENKKTGWAYIFSIPALLFLLSFLISLAKPMIRYHYLLLTACPFLLAIAALVITSLPKNKTGIMAQVLLGLLLSNVLYWGKSDIPSGRYDYYKEARRYITLDAEAHPDKKACMLDNAPHLASYYHEPEMPAYNADERYDVIYVFNREFKTNEREMYDALFEAGLDNANMLKIALNEKVVIFKVFPFH